jgi:hypothetical protein
MPREGLVLVRASDIGYTRKDIIENFLVEREHPAALNDNSVVTNPVPIAKRKHIPMLEWSATTFPILGVEPTFCMPSRSPELVFEDRRTIVHTN